MTANEMQIAGDHYKAAYQHWDWVCDIHAHYLIGCASKYLARWKKKNGLEDLQKSKHYIEKAIERNIISSPERYNYRLEKTSDFISSNGIPFAEGEILVALVTDDYDKALSLLNALIANI